MKKKLFLLILGIGFAVLVSTSAYAMSDNTSLQTDKTLHIQRFVTDVNFQELLGMTAEEIKSELNSGKTIAQLLDEKNVTHEQLAKLHEKKHTAMKNEWFAKNTDIQKLLNMTQEEITKALENGKTIAQLLDEKKISHVQIQQIKKTSHTHGQHRNMKPFNHN